MLKNEKKTLRKYRANNDQLLKYNTVRVLQNTQGAKSSRVYFNFTKFYYTQYK